MCHVRSTAGLTLITCGRLAVAEVIGTRDLFNDIDVEPLSSEEGTPFEEFDLTTKARIWRLLSYVCRNRWTAGLTLITCSVSQACGGGSDWHARPLQRYRRPTLRRHHRDLPPATVRLESERARERDRERERALSQSSTRSVSASERRGNTIKGVNEFCLATKVNQGQNLALDFYLTAKASRLSYSLGSGDV